MGHIKYLDPDQGLCNPLRTPFVEIYSNIINSGCAFPAYTVELTNLDDASSSDIRGRVLVVRSAVSETNVQRILQGVHELDKWFLSTPIFACQKQINFTSCIQTHSLELRLQQNASYTVGVALSGLLDLHFQCQRKYKCYGERVYVQLQPGDVVVLDEYAAGAVSKASICSYASGVRASANGDLRLFNRTIAQADASEVRFVNVKVTPSESTASEPAAAVQGGDDQDDATGDNSIVDLSVAIDEAFMLVHGNAAQVKQESDFQSECGTTTK